MSENISLVPSNTERTVPSILYGVVSNALQIYGILMLGWHFFPILYMWWWEELILSILGLMKLKRLRPFLLEKESEMEVLDGERSVRTRFFLLFVYFVFVVVVGGFVLAPKGSYVENIITLVFRNKVFNVNLALFILLQTLYYYRDYIQSRNYEKVNVAALRSTFDLRSSIIHVGLLAGAVLYYLLDKYAIQTEHAFMFGFMAIKTAVDLWAAFRHKSN